MMAAVGKWQRERKEFSFVEKDDALYVPELSRPYETWGGLVFFLGACAYNFVNSFYLTKSDEYLSAKAAGFSHLLAHVLTRPQLYLFIIVTVAAMTAVTRIVRRRFPLGRPLVQVDARTLTFPDPNHWLGKNRTPLSKLRALTIQKLPRSWLYWPHSVDRYLICCDLIDGDVKSTVAFYAPDVAAAVIGFLRRKLPPSVKFTVDGEALDFGGQR
jgi:hypothetical protein